MGILFVILSDRSLLPICLRGVPTAAVAVLDLAIFGLSTAAILHLV